MHFIDYLPWPVYVLILVFSVIGTLIYVIKDKRLNKVEKIGYSLVVPGGISLIIMKIVEETSFYFEYFSFLWIFVVVAMFGCIIAVLFGYKRINNPKRKQRIEIGLILIGVSLSLFGLLFLYVFITQG